MEINHSDFKILVADDVETNILLLKVFLSNKGFNIVTATNGKEVIEIIEQEKPDLILMDVLMPEMNGFEACKYLKSSSSFSDIPIIFLTALEDGANIAEGFKVGGDDYVCKPFKWEELTVRINHQLELLIAKRTILNKTQELQDTIIARDKMYSVIAHDIRSPMATVKMIMNMLTFSLQENCIGKEMYEMVKDANQITENIFSLLDNLLKWTKSQTGNLNPIFQNINLVDLIKGVTEIIGNVAKIKGIQLVIDVTNSAEVCVDIDMIKTCLRNLISNAIKFSYNDNKIIISLKEEKENYIVSIQDFGQGMNDENAKKLLHTSTHFSTYGTAQEEGSGLGLLLVKDFIEKNNGKLWFESEEGIGSTFYFSLPKSQ